MPEWVDRHGYRCFIQPSFSPLDRLKFLILARAREEKEPLWLAPREVRRLRLKEKKKMPVRELISQFDSLFLKVLRKGDALRLSEKNKPLFEKAEQFAQEALKEANLGTYLSVRAVQIDTLQKYLGLSGISNRLSDKPQEEPLHLPPPPNNKTKRLYNQGRQLKKDLADDPDYPPIPKQLYNPPA